MVSVANAALLLLSCYLAGCGRDDTLAQSQGSPSRPADTAGMTGVREAPTDTPSRRKETPGHRAVPQRAAIPRAEGTVLRLFLGGDVSFGRGIGQRVLSDAEFQPLAALTPWMDASDLRLVNLESVLSEQGGVTVHPQNALVFSGPPSAAETLSGARIDAVSVANNHAWDYGKPGLAENLAHLAQAGIAAAGANMERQPYRAVSLKSGDIKVAFLAFTQVWNDGDLADHAARPFVAGSDYEAMKRALRSARRDHDLVIVSLHASNEYVPLPRERARRFAKALIVSGADLVFGHHPHVLQGLEWISNRLVLYSLGNLVFQSEQTLPETERSAVALVDFRRTENGFELSALRLCPVILEAGVPRPSMWQDFEPTLIRLSKTLGGVETARDGTSGCVVVEQSESPLVHSARRGFAPEPSDPRDLGE